MSATYPLSAIVGQERLVEALLINAVCPEVGGVLVRGQRGTAKSTAVRALAPLLPPIAVAVGETCAFAPGETAPGGRVRADAEVRQRQPPLVELPLGASLDRLLGTLDLSRALNGEAAFEPGLLARAHRGILYVDEVNLLPDHLVDALLDAASSGFVHVEREAISVKHDACFLLVGTMNVEEGELRPQLLDRFGLSVEVSAPGDPSLRAEIVRRRLAFEQDRRAFARGFEQQELQLSARIASAQRRLSSVTLGEGALQRIVTACARLGIEGVRGDIVCARAAIALAALDGADEVSDEHLLRAAGYALAHRRRREPLEPLPSDDAALEEALSAPQPGPSDDGPASQKHEAGDEGRDDWRERRRGDLQRHGTGEAGEGIAPEGERERGDLQTQGTQQAGVAAASGGERGPIPAHIPLAALALDRSGRGGAGRRARSSGLCTGAIDTQPAREGSDDIAIVSTLLARMGESSLAAASGARGRSGAAKASRGAGAVSAAKAQEVGVAVSAAKASRGAGAVSAAKAQEVGGASKLRENVRAGREGTLICLVIDASGSMGARRRLSRVKGALLELLREAYARRDEIAVVCFRGSEAELLIAPGSALERAAAAIESLPTGGATPLAAGLSLACEVLRSQARRQDGRRSIAIVLTDGRVRDDDGSAVAAAARLGRIASTVAVIDTEDGRVRVGIAPALAKAAKAAVHPLQGGERGGGERSTGRRAA